MELKIGESYKTRCGAHVQVMANDPSDSNYPLLIEIVGTVVLYNVTKEGRYLVLDPQNQLDIVYNIDGSPLN